MFMKALTSRIPLVPKRMDHVALYKTVKSDDWIEGFICDHTKMDSLLLVPFREDRVVRGVIQYIKSDLTLERCDATSRPPTIL